MKEIHATGIGGNLDPKTREKLLCINKECIDAVYHELGRTIIKPGKENEEMKALIKDYMNSKNLPERARLKLRRMVQAGMFSTKEADEIDAIVERELDRCMTAKIDRAIKRGELKPPKDDAFSRRMRKRNEKTTRQLFG